MRLLLVEDNKRLSDSLRLTLQEDGYSVDTAYNGPDGEEMALLPGYDLLILDVMMPGRDGLSVCRSLRDQRVKTPILMLTARDALDDRVRGLDSGADDYLVKPFELDELRARLRALLRRDSDSKTSQLQIADLSLDPANHQVQRGGIPITLTAKEYALLEALMRHPNRILSRETLEANLWGYEHIVTSNAVDVYIKRLRRKIDEPSEIKLIETLRGAGYRLRNPAP